MEFPYNRRTGRLCMGPTGMDAKEGQAAHSIEVRAKASARLVSQVLRFVLEKLC
jgi:hypothetical protein